MRKKYLIVFLLSLFVFPMVFISLYASPGVITESNMTKDFSLSEDWYNEDWHYRKSISLKPASGSIEAGYQVLIEVPYDSDMKEDFADVIFVDEEQEPLLDHWLESYNETHALFWVEVQDAYSENNPGLIYMYYGNAEASSTSNGEDTFLFYEDWDSETVDAGRWDQITADGSIAYASGGADHGNIATISGNEGVAVWHIETDLHLASPFAVRFRSNLESTVAASQRTVQGVGTSWGIVEPKSYVWSDAGTETFVVADDDGNDDSQAMVDTYHDTYTVWDITRDDDTALLYADGNLLESGNMAPDTKTTNTIIFYVRDSEYQVLSDWMFVRSFVTVEPEVDSWGEEEDNFPPPEFFEVSEAKLIFIIPLDESGLNMLLTFLGLFMIPASTIYLAKGGKDEMSMDKLFFGLIAFVIGWALFLSGIGFT